MCVCVCVCVDRSCPIAGFPLAAQESMDRMVGNPLKARSSLRYMRFLRSLLVMIASVACACTVLGQPTLTSGQLAYVVGEYTAYDNCGNDGWPQDGAGVTWNYGGLNCFAAGGFDNIVDPAMTAGAAYYPTATAANGDVENAVYFRSLPGADEYLGFYLGAAGYLGLCSDPRTEMQYPFTYGDSFTDAMVCEEEEFYPRVRSGTQSISCTGYGTLVLPNGTFTDCLLLTKTWDYVDVYEGGGEGYRTGEARIIVRPGINRPLITFATNSYTQAGETITNGGITKLSELSTAMRQVSDERLLMAVHVDPLGMVHIQRNGDLPVSVQLVAMDGRVVLTERMNADQRSMTLATNAVSRGAYVVHMHGADGSTAQRIVLP